MARLGSHLGFGSHLVDLARSAAHKSAPGYELHLKTPQHALPLLGVWCYPMNRPKLS